MKLNKRLEQIIRDPYLTTEINLIKRNDDQICEQVNTFIERFSSDIFSSAESSVNEHRSRSSPSLLFIVDVVKKIIELVLD